MNKSILLLISVLTLISCGREKKEPLEDLNNIESLKTSLIIDAVYLKDDSITVFCKNEGFFNYDRPTTYIVKGSELIQRIKIDFASDIPVENFSMVVSTNKEQSTIVIKGISVEQNDKMVFDGSEYKYLDYFLADESFKWDEKNQRSDLSHNNKYPPGIVGSEKIEVILVK